MNKGYKKWGQKLDLTSNYGSWPKSFTIYERQLIKMSSVLKMATEWRKRQSQFAGGNVNLPARTSPIRTFLLHNCQFTTRYLKAFKG